MTALQRVNQRHRVNQAAARSIDQDHARLHLRKRLGIDHVMVIPGCRAVQRNDIAFPVNCFQIRHFTQLCRSLTGIAVIAKQPAAKAGQMPEHRLADPAHADHANDHLRKFTPTLARQRIILQPRTIEHIREFPAAHEHQHDGVIRHRLRRIHDARHAKPQPSGSVHVDMFRADGSGENIAHALRSQRREQRVVHIRHDDADGVAAGS